MTEEYRRAAGAARFIKQSIEDTGSLCVVTGSGLEGILDNFKVIDRIAYSRIPHLKETTFHRGEFIVLEYRGKRFCALQGRLHYYEAYTSKEVAFPIRILSLLGIREIIMTNAAGGLNEYYDAGDIAMVSDHINLLPDNPLRGPNDNRFGVRFPDMSEVYPLRIRNKISELASALNIKLRHGVYVSFQGPSLETPAEYKFLHTIGADMVGMSTVPEVIVAKHCGMRIAVFSVISNVCYPPERIKPTTVDDVIATAGKAVAPLRTLIEEVIQRNLMGSDS